MQFPQWVLKTRGKKNQASARLRYILVALALQLNQRASLRGVSKFAGCDHSTLSYYVKQGAFSENMALQLEKKFGADVVRHEWLTDPLSIATQ